MRVSRIAVKQGDVFVAMPVERFLALSLEERVQLILQQRIKFYDEKDAEIPVKEGARLLRETAANTPPPEPSQNGQRVLTVEQFLALPVSERVSLLLDRRVRLVNERGEEVTMTEALRSGRS